MAYLKELRTRCEACGSPATVQLFHALNVPLGRYCRPCGAAQLDVQNRREAEWAAVASQRTRPESQRDL